MGVTLVDEIGNLRIGGKNQTDHNTITTDIKINNKQKPIMIKSTKLNHKEGWHKFNEKLANSWKQTKEERKPMTYVEFEETVRKGMRENLGVTCTRKNRKIKQRSGNVKEKRPEMKTTRGLQIKMQPKPGTKE